MKKAANNDQFYSIKAHYFGTKQTERSVHYSQIKNKQLNYMLTSLNSLHNSVKKVTSEKAEKSLRKCINKYEKISQFENVLMNKSLILWKTALQKAK